MLFYISMTKESNSVNNINIYDCSFNRNNCLVGNELLDRGQSAKHVAGTAIMQYLQLHGLLSV